MTAPRHAVLDAARTQAGMSLHELWIAYFALGGEVQLITMRAYLDGQGPQLRDHDVLAQAINERFVELGGHRPVPYGDDPD